MPKLQVLTMVGWIGCAALVSACGSSNSGERLPRVNFGKATVASCLKDGGAVFAKSPSELKFLFAAEKNEEVSKFALAFDNEAKVVIRLWGQATFENQPAAWQMWVAQPFGKDLSPTQIIKARSRGSYVAYVVHPAPGMRRRLMSCISVRAKGHEPPPVVLHSDDFTREGGG